MKDEIQKDEQQQQRACCWQVAARILAEYPQIAMGIGHAKQKIWSTY